MTDALSRARSNKGQLLRGYTIYCTEQVHGGFDTYKAIIEVNGGKCLLYRARAGTSQALRAGSAHSDTESKAEYIFLVSGTTPEECRLWPRFRQMAETSNKIPEVVRHDWLLQMALSQQTFSSEDFVLTERDISISGP